MNDERDVSRKSKEVDLESGEVLQDEVTVIGNSKVVSNALEELNRVDVSEMSDEDIRAYSDVLESMTWLRESLDGGDDVHEDAARTIKEISNEVSKLEKGVAEGLSDELQKQNVGGVSDGD